MTALALAGRTLRLALPLYLATLAVGVLLTAVGMLGIWLLAGDRPWRGGLLGPNWLNLTVEMLMSALSGGGAPGAALILLAYGAFGLSSVADMMYLTQVHNFKFNKLRALWSLLPPIERLEAVISRLLVIGLILLTAGLAVTPWLLHQKYQNALRPDHLFADAKRLCECRPMPGPETSPSPGRQMSHRSCRSVPGTVQNGISHSEVGSGEAFIFR